MQGMNPDEITDIEALNRWLNGRLRFQAQVIATRAVLRVFPLWSRLVNAPKYPGVHLTDLPVIHHLILSGVAAVFPEPEVWRAASEATTHHFARHAVESARTVAFAANSLVDFAAAARSKDDLFDANDKFSTESFSAVSGAIAAADKFASGGPDIWEQIREDARAIARGDNPFSLPLWSIPQPDWFRQADAEGTAIGVRNASGFLSRWWDGILSGEQLSWDLQREVALIPNPDSGLDLAHIAAVIAKSEMRAALSASANAEKVEINPNSGLLRLVPDSDIPDDIALYARRKMAKARALFPERVALAQHYTAIQPDLDLLENTLRDASNLPMELFDTCASVSGRVIHRANSGECPGPDQDPIIADFLHRIREAGADILAADPKTQQAIANRNAILGNNALIDQRVALVVAARDIALASEGPLALLPTVADLATNPNADAEDRKIASFKLAGRLIRVHTLVKVSAATLGLGGGYLTIEGLANSPSLNGAFQAAMKFIGFG